MLVNEISFVTNVCLPALSSFDSFSRFVLLQDLWRVVTVSSAQAWHWITHTAVLTAARPGGGVKVGEERIKLIYTEERLVERFGGAQRGAETQSKSTSLSRGPVTPSQRGQRSDRGLLGSSYTDLYNAWSLIALPTRAHHRVRPTNTRFAASQSHGFSFMTYACKLFVLMLSVMFMVFSGSIEMVNVDTAHFPHR